MALAVLLFWFGASYGLKAPFYYGHYGFHGGSYAAWARGTLRHHTIYPINEVGFRQPTPASYYLHHPVLTHQLVTLTFALFGEHEWSVRAGALIPSFLALILVTLIAWKFLSPLAGGAAAIAFALVPVNVWYESHIDQGFPSITCLLAFCFFYLRWLASGRWRFGAAALAFEALAGNFEWSPYFAAIPIFMHVWWIALRRRRQRRYLAFALLQPVAVVLPLLFHYALVSHAGLAGDMRGAFHNRTASTAYPLFVDVMKRYADSLYGDALLVVMAGWIVMKAVRLLRLRARSVDVVPMVFAFAVITYMHFFQNAVITHGYRQLYGNVWAALAVADLVDGARRLALRLFRRRIRRVGGGRPVTRVFAAAVLIPVVVLTSKVSWSGLLESRLHGGVPGWASLNPDLRQTGFAIKLLRTTTRRDEIYFHPTHPWVPPHRMDWGFYYDRNVHRQVPLRSLLALSIPQRMHAIAVLMPQDLRGEDIRLFGELARQHPVWQVENLAAIDLRFDGASVEAYRVVPANRPLPRVVPHSLSATMSEWLEGPYPFPRLERDPAAEARLRARIAEAQPAGKPAGKPTGMPAGKPAGMPAVKVPPPPLPAPPKIAPPQAAPTRPASTKAAP